MLVCFKDEHRKLASQTVIQKSIGRQRRMTPVFMELLLNLSIIINFHKRYDYDFVECDYLLKLSMHNNGHNIKFKR